MATTTRPHAQVHTISTLHRTVVTPHKALGQHRIADSATCAAANADSIACAANNEHHHALASAVSPNVMLHSAAFRQQCLSARVISANTVAQSADSRQHCSTADTNSTNAAAHLANFQQQCSAANANSADAAHQPLVNATRHKFTSHFNIVTCQQFYCTGKAQLYINLTSTFDGCNSAQAQHCIIQKSSCASA
jgi:hypothetical protein